MWTSIGAYPDMPADTRKSSTIRDAWGGTPPERAALGLMPLTFWDGTVLPGGCHPLIAEPLRALDDVFRRFRYRLDKSADDWCYARRQIKAGGSWSLHSWAIAVDVNAQANPYATAFASDMPPALIDGVYAIKHPNGRTAWTWGGQWGRLGYRFDAMHFQINLTPDECRTFAWQQQSAPVADQQDGCDNMCDRLTLLEQRVGLMGYVVGEQTTVEQQVTAAYRAVFNREPDPDGLTYWAERIKSGELNAEQVLNELQFLRDMGAK